MNLLILKVIRLKRAKTQLLKVAKIFRRLYCGGKLVASLRVKRVSWKRASERPRLLARVFSRGSLAGYQQEASSFQGSPVFLFSKKPAFLSFHSIRNMVNEDREGRTLSHTVSTYGYGLVNIGNLALFTAPRIRVTYPYTEIETMYLNISGLWMC